MEAQPEVALAFVPKIVILIGVIVVIGLLVAVFSSRSWLGALAALFGLLLLAVVLGGSLLVFRVGRNQSVRVAEMPPPPPVPQRMPPAPELPSPPVEPPLPSNPTAEIVAEAPDADVGATQSYAPQASEQSAAPSGDGQHAQRADWRTWTAAGAVRVGDVYRMPVEIGPYETRAECNAEQPQVLREAVHRYANQLLGEGAGDYVDVPLPYIYQNIVRADCEEHRQTSVGRMLVVHNLLEFDRTVNDHLRDIHQRAVVAKRLRYTGLGAAGVFGLLATAFGYLKLDTLSRGYYTGRLRAAAAVAILGLAVGLFFVAWFVNL